MKKKRKILGIFKKCYFFAHFPKTGMAAAVARSADAAAASAACTFFAMERVALTPPLRLRLVPGTPPIGDAGSALTFFAMESLIRSGKCDCGEARLCYLI